MIGGMKRRLIGILLCLTFVLATPCVSLAQDEDAPKFDARLEGYGEGQNMALKDAGGTAVTWLLLIVLAGLCLGVMFMHSKRTHLD
jgi:hypothetical protein